MADIITELNRLETAKENIKTAIRNKGVYVPDNKLLSDYAGLVSSISAGSAGSVITCNIENGSTDPVPSDFFDNYFLFITYYNSSGTLTMYEVTSLAEPITLPLLGDDSAGALLLFESDCPYVSVGGSSETADASYPLVFDDTRQYCFNYEYIYSGDTVKLHYSTIQ